MISDVINSFGLENNKAVFYMNAVAINFALPILKEYKRRNNVPNPLINEVVMKFFKYELERVGYKDEGGLDINLLDGDYPTSSAYPTANLFSMFEKALTVEMISPFAKVGEIFDITKTDSGASIRNHEVVNDMCVKFVEEFCNWEGLDNDRRFINAMLGGTYGSLSAAMSESGVDIVTLHPLFKVLVRKEVSNRFTKDYTLNSGVSLIEAVRGYIYFDESLDKHPELMEFVNTVKPSLVKSVFDTVNNICVVGDDMIRKGSTIVELFNYRRSIIN